MTSTAEIVTVARQFTRDFGTFFELTFPDVQAPTLRLPHPLIDGSSLVVIDNASEAAVTDYTLNARTGMLKLADPTAHTEGVYVCGTHYLWFLDEDLEFHAALVTHEHLHGRTGVTLGEITGVEVEVMGIGTLVSALWSLLTELSTDIDVASPEGMSIPARQRYQQVLQLLQTWGAKYDEKTALLNVGLKRIEMGTLRRISRLTNRYVPVYRGRELDNPRPPVRVRPPIDPIHPSLADEDAATWGGASSVESFDLGYGGWDSLGQSG